MNIRRILVIFGALILVVTATALWSAATIERDGDTDANVIEDSGSSAGTAVEKSGDAKTGNKVARAIAAPFKMFGKLFGHKDKNKLARMTDKDAANFESVGVSRVDDSLAPKQGIVSGSAKDHLAAGRSLLKSGQLNQAITELSTAVSLDPNLAEAHSPLGVAFDQKGLHDRAKESYEKAIRVGADDAQALNNLGFSLYQNGNYRAAVDRLKRAAKLAPKDERILNNLALALCRLGKFDDAYKSFARAGGELTGRLNTASILERMGRDDEAIKYYEAAKRVDPNNAIAAHRLSDLYQRTGRTATVATSGSAEIASR